MHVVYLNQDPGIAPGRKKGAAVHVAAMQEAFLALGSRVTSIEEKLDEQVGPRLERLQREVGIDLVYERYALGAGAGASFCRRTGVRRVLEVNAPLLEEERVHRGGKRSAQDELTEARIFDGARILAVSTEVARYVAQRGVPMDKIEVSPNGVDCERFFPRPTDALRRRLGIAPGAFVLGFHGRLRPWHGFDALVRVLSRLLAWNRPVHLLAVGDGPFEARLQDPRLRAKSTVVGWLPHEEVARYVACFDALPLTYPPDAPCYFSPLKLFEAMACAAVPLVPALGDLPDLVSDGVDGIVYRAGSEGRLAAAIAGLIADPAQRARLGRNARQTAREHSWSAAARRVLGLGTGRTPRSECQAGACARAR